MRESGLNRKSISAVFKREFRSFFQSPAAYIVIIAYLGITGWLFFSTFFLQGRLDMRGFFRLMPMVFAFTIPAVTMRLFSEEYRSGSYELLETQPVSTADIVAAKFLSALLFVAVMLVPTLSYPLWMSSLGDLDSGPVIGGYVGTLLLAASYTAVGLFGSSCSVSQIVAFIISAVICFFLSIINQMLVLLPTGLTGVFQGISSMYHFNNIARGVLDIRDILYFLSLTCIGLYATWLINRERN
jgi:ABC-2 type transport system permease protein